MKTRKDAITFGVTNRCNNSCAMCIRSDEYRQKGSPDQKNDSYRETVERLMKIKEKIAESKEIYLGGGEPTIHPNFSKVFWFVRNQFPHLEIRLLTNARRFAYEKFADDILKADNISIIISLCGPNASVHDGITQVKGSFDQTIRGLENILARRKEGQEVEVRIIISKLLYRHLGETIAFVNRRFPAVDRVIAIFMEIEGQAEKNFKETVVSYTKVKSFIDKIYDVVDNGRQEMRLYHFPLCVLSPKFWPFTWITLPPEELTFNNGCNQHCLYKKHCLGIHKKYLEYMGDEEFKPITKKFEIGLSQNPYHPIASVK